MLTKVVHCNFRARCAHVSDQQEQAVHKSAPPLRLRSHRIGTKRWIMAPVVWAMALGLWMAAGIPLASIPQADAQEADTQDTANGEHNGVARAESLSRVFRAAAKKVIPTVVKIKTTTKPKAGTPGNGEMLRENPFKGTPFEEFFDDQLPGFGIDPRMPTPRRQGLGSGVIIDPRGIIVTNNHVVEGADEVLVELSDGQQFTATDIKTDSDSDLAVLRIDAKKTLPAATLGDSSKMEIGDWVIAVGNPFELELTVSAGIISGKGRVLPSSKRAQFLQTDAAINPGNSGGPLVNLNGEVVGINTAIASSSGGYQGVGFAIPANLVKWITGQLVTRGNVERAYLGVGISEVTGEVARKLRVPAGRGVLVTEVFNGTPAAEAGFEAGDVIVAYAGQPVNAPRQLQEIVERSSAGSRQRADILRNGAAKSLQVVVKPLPKEFGSTRAPAEHQREQQPPREAFDSEDLGLKVTEMTDALAKQLGYEGLSGVVVSDVAPNGVAAAMGIREGMLVLRVGKTAVKSVTDFKTALKGQSLDDGILLLVRTRSGNRFIVLKR